MTTPGTRGHTFDGIEEFDNRLPNWWLWSFYLAAIFSVGYWVHYHTLGTGDSPAEAFAKVQEEAARQLAKHALENPVTDEILIALSQNASIVAEGEKIFKDPTKCALCHKPDASGLIGPNLTDSYWVYGNTPMDIYTTILKGRAPDPEKGYVGGMMPHEPFGKQFVQRVTAYTLTVMDSNLPGKPPEPNAKQMPRSW